MSEAVADFSPAGYRMLLTGLLSRGYEVRRFQSADPGRQHLILRHDVDLWPEVVRVIGRVEAELGVSAVYFFLTDSPLYEISSQSVRSAIRDLVGMGHEIGLHFDAKRHADDTATLDSAASAACALLEAVSGQPVETVSFHRPSRSFLASAAPIAGRVHAYQPRFFKEMDYCSDSRGGWRHGPPLERDAVQKGRALQLLTHPIWWVHEDGCGPEAALARLVAAKGDAIKPAIAETVTGYDPRTGRILE